MFTLYTTPLSANGRKPLVLSELLGLCPETHEVNVYTGEGRAPEYLSINPFGKIPTLVDGELTLWESNAILQYISEAYGENRLYASAPARRADISRWLYWEAAHWQPAFIPVLAGPVGHLLRSGSASHSPVEADWHDPRLRALLEFLDRHLTDRPFVVGEELTIADISIGAMMMYLRPVDFPFDEFPRLDAWYGRLEGLDAWRKTAAGPWKDAP